MLGEAVQVRLSSIPPGGITRPKPFTVHIDGDRKLVLEELPAAEKLAELLEQRGHLPPLEDEASREEGARVLSMEGTRGRTRRTD
jgi:hypothetical protein